MRTDLSFGFVHYVFKTIIARVVLFNSAGFYFHFLQGEIDT